MKLLKLAFLTLFITTLHGCQQSKEIIKPETSELEIIFLSESMQLQDVVNRLNREFTSNGRTTSLLSDVDFEQALKKFNVETGITHFTFSMYSEDQLTLRKFILRENQAGELWGQVLEFEIDPEWLILVDSFPSWGEYNGWFRVLELDGSVIAENIMENGSSQGSNANGRVSGTACTTTITDWYTCDGNYSNCRFNYTEIATSCTYVSGSGGGGSWGGNDGMGLETINFRDVDMESGNTITLSLADKWESEICTSQSFNSNTCLSSVLSKMKTTNAAASMLDAFENSPWIELCLGTGVNNPSAYGQTSISGSSVTINFNTSKLNRSSLSIARTFLHEMVHAELYRKVKSVGGQVSQDNFPGIYDYYRRNIKNWQHQQMAGHYIETIAKGLSLFDGEIKGLSYYRDIAWIGLWKVPDRNNPNSNGTYPLIESDAWKSLSPTERNRIKSAMTSFKQNENKTCQ